MLCQSIPQKPPKKGLSGDFRATTKALKHASTTENIGSRSGTVFGTLLVSTGKMEGLSGRLLSAWVSGPMSIANREPLRLSAKAAQLVILTLVCL